MNLDIHRVEKKRPRFDQPTLAIDNLAAPNLYGRKLACAMTTIVGRFKIDRRKVHRIVSLGKPDDSGNEYSARRLVASGIGFQPVEAQMTGWKPIPLISRTILIC